MTDRSMTPEEIARSDATYRQWWASVVTLGLIRKPELGHSPATRERELEAGG